MHLFNTLYSQFHGLKYIMSKLSQQKLKSIDKKGRISLACCKKCTCRNYISRAGYLYQFRTDISRGAVTSHSTPAERILTRKKYSSQ